MAGVVDFAKKNLGLAPDAKLTFCATTLDHLATASEPVPSSSYHYWTTYFQIFDSASDVTTLMPTHTLRAIRRRKPHNLATLVRVMTSRLHSLTQEPKRQEFAERERMEARSAATASGWSAMGRVLPRGLKASAKGFVSGVAAQPGSDVRGNKRELLNAVRVLTRILPFVYESSVEGEAEDGAFAHSVFWSPIPVEKQEDPEAAQAIREAAQFVIDDDEDDEDAEAAALNPLSPKSPRTTPTTPSDRPPLVHALLNAVLSFLFLPGVTVPALEPDSPQAGTLYPIWNKGIGSPAIPVEHSNSHDAAKLEGLRLLLAILSEPLYSSPQQPNEQGCESDDSAFKYFTSVISRGAILASLCSLLNTSLSPAHASMHGLSFAGIGGRIVGRRGGEGLAEVCSQVLAILLMPQPSVTSGSRLQSPVMANHPLPSSKPHPLRNSSNISVATITSQAANMRDVGGNNLFRLYLSKLHRPSDFIFLANGILACLSKPMDLASQLLPTSSTASSVLGMKTSLVPIGVAESLLLLYSISSCNPKFMTWIASDTSSTSIGPNLVVALVYLLLEHKDGGEATANMLRLSGILLQDLTSQRGLVQRLAKEECEMPGGIRSKYGVPGSYAQFLIVSVCSIIFSTLPTIGEGNASSNRKGSVERRGLEAVYPALVISVTNVSGGVLDLSKGAATRWCQLFMALSDPEYILAEEGNIRLVYYLLEAFNSVIHSKFKENPWLTYSLIRIYAVFDRLANFTLSDSVKYIRLRQRRIEQESRVDSEDNAMSRDGNQYRSMHSQSKVSLQSPSRENSNENSGMTSLESNGPDDSVLGSHDLTLDDIPSGSLGSGLRTLSNESPVKSRTRLSDKGKGKMRERSLSITTSEPASEPASGVMEETDVDVGGVYMGKNGFIPTEAWIASWRASLPLDTIQIMIAELRPQVNSLSSLKTSSIRKSILDFLSSPQTQSSLSTHLPSPSSSSSFTTTTTSKQQLQVPQSKLRRFSPSTASMTWLHTFAWSLVIIRHSDWWKGVQIQLFGVKTNESTMSSVNATTRGIVQGLGSLNVANSMGGVWEVVRGGSNRLTNWNSTSSVGSQLQSTRESTDDGVESEPLTRTV